MKDTYVYIIEGDISKFYSNYTSIDFRNFMFTLDNIQEYIKNNNEHLKINEASNFIINEGSIKRFRSSFENEIPLFIKLLKDLHILEKIYILLPTQKLKESLKSYFQLNEYEEIYYDFDSFNDEEVIKSYKHLSNVIKNQTKPLKNIHENLINYSKSNETKIIFLYGPSGVGKTETVKQVSNCILGKNKLKRIQFSMLNDTTGIEYIFGNNKYEKSLLEDIQSRDSNFLLFDEFDKCPSHLYNVFYQMFDESKFSDNHFEVDLHGTIIFCTSNFKNLNEIKTILGEPIFNRIDVFVEYKNININEKRKLLIDYYNQLMDTHSSKYPMLLSRRKELLQLLLNENLENLTIRGIYKMIEKSLNQYIFNELLNE